jgi:hypothetical protein
MLNLLQHAHSCIEEGGVRAFLAIGDEWTAASPKNISARRFSAES